MEQWKAPVRLKKPIKMTALHHLLSTALPDLLSTAHLQPKNYSTELKAGTSHQRTRLSANGLWTSELDGGGERRH